MYLEIGKITPALCQPQFHVALRLYQNSQPVEAMTTAFADLRKLPAGSPASATEWLLLGNLAQICGMTSRSQAAWKLGYRAFPTDWRLALVHAWELSVKGASSQCMKVIKQGITNTPEQKAVFHALACYNHSLNRWKKTAAKFHRSAIGLAEDDAVVTYILSRAAAKRTDWQQAIELGQRVVELKPKWTRARTACFDSLLCVGKLDEAAQMLDSPQGELRHVWKDFSKAVFLEISDRHDDAIEYLDLVIHYYPKNSKMIKFCCRQLVLLLMRANQIERAREIVKAFSMKGFEDWEKSLSSDQRKAYISVPLIAQTTNHCVPTVAAMVARAQAFEMSAVQLAEKMETRHGTPMWKMIDTMKDLGFTARCVKPDTDIVEKMLDQNVPLIGELSGVFSGHVDVVCGYDSGLKLLHLRDPMHWYGYSIPYDGLEKRYQGTCSLWALIAPDRAQLVNIDRAWINHEAESMVDLCRAVALGKRAQAEAAYEKIEDEHPLSFSRDCLAKNVVLTASQTDKRLRQEIDSIDLDTELTLPQVRSMLAAIDEQNADHIYQLAKKNSKRLGPSWVQYVQAQVLLTKMKWKEADQTLTILSKRWPAMESVWSQLGQVKTELGQPEQAQRCFDIALEIAPEREYFQTQSIARLKHKITYQQQLKKILAVAKKFPWAPEIHLSIAAIMADGDDGLAYEKILKRCIRFFPRNPWGYQQLATWYLTQDRNDLAKVVMKAGRKLLGEELPVSDFELTLEQRKEKKQNNDSESDTSQVAVTNPQDGDAPVENLFTQHYRILVERSTTDDFETFQALQELREVKEADRQHAFTWMHSAELLSLEIGNLLSDRSDSMKNNIELRLKKLDELLPGKVAGIGELFAEHLLGTTNFEWAEPNVIKRILDWTEKIAPLSKQYPDLEFYRAYLMENLSQFNRSEEILNQIIRDHPAYVSAWYRLGQLYSQRNELPRAWSMFEKSIALQPGHYGALCELSRLAPQVHPERVVEFVDLLAKRFPYSQQCALDAAVARIKGTDTQAAIEQLQRQKKQLGESKYATTSARLLFDAGKDVEALQQITNVEIDPEDQYAANWIRVDCYVQQNNLNAANKCLDELESHSPDDGSVIDQKVRLLRAKSMDRAVDYAQKKIQDGHALSILAYVTLAEGSNRYQRARAAVESVDKKFQDATATAYYQGLSELSDGEAMLSFLQYCHKQFPHLTDLSESLVYQLGTNGKTKESVKVAEALYKKDPDDPRTIGLLGWAVQDIDAKKSISLLRKEFELTDSVETLSRLGRGYQISGKDKLAKETYRKVLLRNPNHTVAMTNLMFRYGQNDKKMLECIVDTIEKGMVGRSDQYFLVQVLRTYLMSHF